AFLQAPRLPERLLHGAGGPWFRDVLVRTGLDEGDARRYVDALFEVGPTGPFNWYRALRRLQPRADRPVRVPTLYVYGTGDAGLARWAADRTGDHVAGPYRYEVIEEARHW